MPKVNIYLPDRLAEQVRAHEIPVSQVCQAALEKEVKRMATTAEMQKEMERIEVEMWRGDADEAFAERYELAFTGRWLLEPDPEETRTTERGHHDAGAYWGVALTAKGKIAVYVAHCNDGFAPGFHVYDDLGQFKNQNYPQDIIDQATAALTGSVELDI